MCAVSGHRCLCPPSVPIFKEFNHGIFGVTIVTILRGVTLSKQVTDVLLRLHMSGHMAGVTQCPGHPHSSYQSSPPCKRVALRRCLPKVSPSAPHSPIPSLTSFFTRLSRPQSLSNSELYIFTPHRLSPSSLS